ncbi:MAG: putative rane protein [Labilithrix sp.]|nr:putative rane protein [Labilithrix sp.]
MNLLEPWVLLRLSAGLVACLLFARGALTAQKVLRHFDVQRATEGQLALEKQIELGATFVRIASVVQVLALALSVLGADRMSRGVRGAMCAYGVFGANEWGFRSLVVTGGVALLAGVLAQVYAFDTRVRALSLARPLAYLTLAMFPLSAFDLACAAEFLGKLDLTVVASCCSVQLDPVAAAGEGFASGPRVLVTVLAALGTVASIGLALLAARTPTRARVMAAAAVTLLTLPAAIGASVLEVAPHVFEIPQHVCPFCLLRADVYAIGYPLYGALFLATTWAVGAGVSALLARGEAASDALGPFARVAMRRGAWAWGFALIVAVLPIARFALVSGGASLFPSP